MTDLITDEIVEAAAQKLAASNGWHGLTRGELGPELETVRPLLEAVAPLIAARALAAEQITTLTDLMGTPRGTVVRSAAGTIASRFDDVHGVLFGDDRPFPWNYLELPAVVLLRGTP